MKKVIILGDGGHAKVVIDIINEMIAIDATIEIEGVTSLTANRNELIMGYKILGNDDVLLNYSENKDIFVAIGIGGFKDNSLREKVFNKINGLGFNFLNVIHPTAIISKSVKLGKGIVIFPNVVLNTNVEIGNNSIIATSASIDHDTIVHDHVLVSAGVTVGANTKIGKSSLLALGSKVISSVSIGENVLVASGAVVVNNVKDNTAVFGIPAKEKSNYYGK